MDQTGRRDPAARGRAAGRGTRRPGAAHGARRRGGGAGARGAGRTGRTRRRGRRGRPNSARSGGAWRGPGGGPRCHRAGRGRARRRTSESPRRPGQGQEANLGVTARDGAGPGGGPLGVAVRDGAGRGGRGCGPPRRRHAGSGRAGWAPCPEAEPGAHGRDPASGNESGTRRSHGAAHGNGPPPAGRWSGGSPGRGAVERTQPG